MRKAGTQKLIGICLSAVLVTGLMPGAAWAGADAATNSANVNDTATQNIDTANSSTAANNVNTTNAAANTNADATNNIALDTAANIAAANANTTTGNTEANTSVASATLLATTNAYDKTKTTTLTNNLLAKFLQGGANAAITNNTFYAALAASALGSSSKLDTTAMKQAFATAESDSANPLSAGAMSKYILALTAAGIDCTSYNGRNLIDEMEQKITDSETVYSAVMILPVYQSYTDNNGVAAKMTKLILATQATSGLFGGDYADTQTTAQAVLALAKSTDSDVKTAVSKAVAGIKAEQSDDGGFLNGSWSTASDVDTTGNVVAALVACGIDVTTECKTASGSDPLGYLVAAADTNLDGYSSAYSPEMAAADALAGLAAFSANKNIYDIEMTPDNPVTPTNDATNTASATTNVSGAINNTSSGTSSGTTTPKTGDVNGPLAGAATAAVAATLAAVAGLLALRRKYE